MMWLEYRGKHDDQKFQRLLLVARIAVFFAAVAFLTLVADYAYKRGRAISDVVEWVETVTSWTGILLGTISIMGGRKCFPV